MVTERKKGDMHYSGTDHTLTPFLLFSETKLYM